MSIAAANVRDFQFVGESNLQRIREELLSRIQAFCAGWWSDPEVLKLIDVYEFYSETGLYQEFRVHRNVRFGNEHIVFIGDNTVWQQVLLSLFEGEMVGGSELEAFVLSRFCLDFCHYLVGDDGSLSEVTIDAHDESVNRYGSGCVALEFDVNGVPFSILITRGIWQSLLGLSPVKTHAGQVVPLISSLAPSQAELQVFFDAAPVSCETIMSMKTGDFVPLGQDFTGTVKVSCGDDTHTFSASLGKIGVQRAIKIK